MNQASPAKTRTTRVAAIAGGLAFALIATGCTASTSAGGNSDGKTTTITVATAAVPQFDDIRTMTTTFEAKNPGIKVKYVNLPEDQLRDQLTQGVATGSSPYDVVSIGPSEVPLWAKNGWLAPIDQQVKADPSFDEQDIIPAILSGLKENGKLYGVPISGESSMLMYRKDLFQAAGLTMPKDPTWSQVVDLAAKLNDPSKHIAGICLRGNAAWGDAMAALNPMINAYGGVWYTKDWKPALSSPQAVAAISTYLKLQREDGISGASSAGFPECLNAFSQGNVAIWFDATSAGADVENPSSSKVVGKVGYAPAPVQAWQGNGWLWSWNLAITATSKKKEAAWKYLEYFGSKQYVQDVGKKLGWGHAPAATRTSTYSIQAYRKQAPYADVTLSMIAKADPNKHPQPVPYSGILFLILPTYEDFGTQVAKVVSGAINSNESAESVAKAADAILARYAGQNRSWSGGK